MGANPCFFCEPFLSFPHFSAAPFLSTSSWFPARKGRRPLVLFPAGRGKGSLQPLQIDRRARVQVESGCPPGRVILAAAVSRCQGITYRIGRGTDLQSVRVVADGLQIRPTMIRQPPRKSRSRGQVATRDGVVGRHARPPCGGDGRRPPAGCTTGECGSDLRRGAAADCRRLGFRDRIVRRRRGSCLQPGSRPRPVATVAEIFSQTPATTLLVSVEPCSEPDIAPPRDLFGHHAACQRGAMFPTRRRPDHCVQRREHRSTLASSVVAKQRISGGFALVLNTVPRWRAAW